MSSIFVNLCLLPIQATHCPKHSAEFALVTFAEPLANGGVRSVWIETSHRELLSCKLLDLSFGVEIGFTVLELVTIKSNFSTY